MIVKYVNSPLVMAKSVIVCHLSIATRHPPSTRRQLRSMTSLLVSPPSEARTACRRSRAKVPEGKRKDVMMTYPWGERESLSCLNLCLDVRKKREDREPKGDVLLSIALQIVLQDKRDREINKKPTLSAPASIHSFALVSLIPPPTCRPPGHAASASRAA